MRGPDAVRLDDVVDAEFVTLDRSGMPLSVSRTASAPSRPQIAASTPQGMAMLSREPLRQAAPHTSGGPIFWAGGLVVALAAFWVAGGHALLAPAVSGATHASDGLRIASVVSRVDRSGLKPLLLVDGKAVNDGLSARKVPPLHIQIVSSSGTSTLYKLGTGSHPLDGGDSFDFSSRLDLPKDGVKTVFVTFEE